jgi:dihydroxyacetone kinase-like predicted kinase
MINKYNLEFILHTKNSSPQMIKSSLAEFGNDLIVSQCQEQDEKCNYKVSMITEDPTLVFDLCAQLGRIRSVKVA